jgi:hypothetical protein
MTAKKSQLYICIIQYGYCRLSTVNVKGYDSEIYLENGTAEMPTVHICIQITDVSHSVNKNFEGDEIE